MHRRGEWGAPDNRLDCAALCAGRQCVFVSSQYTASAGAVASRRREKRVSRPRVAPCRVIHCAVAHIGSRVEKGYTYTCVVREEEDAAAPSLPWRCMKAACCVRRRSVGAGWIEGRSNWRTSCGLAHNTMQGAIMRVFFCSRGLHVTRLHTSRKLQERSCNQVVLWWK